MLAGSWRAGRWVHIIVFPGQIGGEEEEGIGELNGCILEVSGVCGGACIFLWRCTLEI